MLKLKWGIIAAKLCEFAQLGSTNFNLTKYWWVSCGKNLLLTDKIFLPKFHINADLLDTNRFFRVLHERLRLKTSSYTRRIEKTSIYEDKLEILCMELYIYKDLYTPNYFFISYIRSFGHSDFWIRNFGYSDFFIRSFGTELKGTNGHFVPKNTS